METLFRLTIILMLFIPLMVIIDVILREKLIFKYNCRSLFLDIVRKIMVFPLIVSAALQGVICTSRFLKEWIEIFVVLLAYIYPVFLIIEGIVLLCVRKKKASVE